MTRFHTAASGRFFCALLLLLASFPASANCTKLAYASIAADVITTVGAIESGRGREANPVINAAGDSGVYPMLAITALIRVAVVYQIDRKWTFYEMTRTTDGRIETIYGAKRGNNWNCAFAVPGLAAAGNNAAIWAGHRSADSRIGAAVGAGVFIPLGVWYFGGRR